MISLEYELFLNIREQVKEHIPRLQALAKAVSELMSCSVLQQSVKNVIM